MRLIIVALLGIEITIIALASAASAATHPEVVPAGSGPYEAGPAVTAVELLSNDFDMGPYPWAFDRLMLTYDRLAEMRRWPEVDARWPLAAVDRAHVARSKPVRDEQRETREAIRRDETWGTAHLDGTTAHRGGTRETAREALEGPVHTGVAQMPQARPRVAYKRAQVDLTRALPRKSAMRMSHATANGWLKMAGVRMRSTGGCASKEMHHCTSLDKVRAGTITRAIELKQESGCPILVTGGTERGHAPGHFSHGNGYKLDISHNACIDRHITKNHHKAGVRSDGAAIYKSKAGSGTTFFDESDHWDILFR